MEFHLKNLNVKYKYLVVVYVEEDDSMKMVCTLRMK